jgi:hypothetical protein
MIERKNGAVYVQCLGQMITLKGKKFVNDSDQPVDGRKVRGILRNEQNTVRREVIFLRSAFNRFFGGDAKGNLYKF